MDACTPRDGLGSIAAASAIGEASEVPLHACIGAHPQNMLRADVAPSPGGHGGSRPWGLILETPRAISGGRVRPSRWATGGTADRGSLP